MSELEQPGPMVEVHWVDSVGIGDWGDPEQAMGALAKLPCRSVGYQVAEDERGLVIVLGVGATGQYLHAMAIPRAAITNVVRLRR